jgi:hypothetical protein
MGAKQILFKFLTSKIVLNVILVVAFLNIVGLLVLNDYKSIIYYILFALLLTYFSKNMIIVLGVPLILINIVSLAKSKEGLENNNNKEKKQPLAHMPDTDLGANDDTNDGTNADDSTSGVEANDESFEVGRAKKGGYNIDYAATVEGAYDELNKILGSDGIKNLTDDTQKLMKQQMQLAESMKSMEPFIKNMGPMLQQAQGILGGLGANQKDGLGGIMEMAKKLGATPPQK